MAAPVPAAKLTSGMAFIEGGTFRMGSNRHYPEEAPVHRAAPNYCRRYRPAARHAQPVDTSTSHVGFRCIIKKTGNPQRSTGCEN
jgi:formylglycine-generating enzyme required for sulfatase activity